MSGFPELDRYDGLGLADLIRRRAVTPTEILDETLARIEARNPAINAVVTRMDEQARAALAAGLPAGPFTGVPYLLKDLGALYTGVVTSYGGTLFADNVADHDSEMTLRLKRAGLVIVGKSNTPEMGLAPSTEPRRFGPTRNPWNLGYSAGGSSGGAAAAVAAGILPMAHATDGGGSIRIPASCCGLFGLKPTRARNPMGPDAGEGWGGASVGHAVTWSVRDSAALLDATSGPDVGDPYWAPAAGRSLPGRGRPRSRPAAHRAHRDAVDRLTGGSGVRGGRPRRGQAVREPRPLRRGGAARHRREDVARGHPRDRRRQHHVQPRGAGGGARALAGRGDVERMTWDRVLDARTMTAAQYAGSIGVVHRVGRTVARFFEGYDVILSPTMCAPPQPLGVLDMSTEHPDRYLAAVFASIGFTSLFNSSGHPAMTVPLATSTKGLPLGVQFAGRFGDEATLLRLAAQLEAAQPWADRRPSLQATAGVEARR